jgi:hypothetical protein
LAKPSESAAKQPEWARKSWQKKLIYTRFISAKLNVENKQSVFIALVRIAKALGVRLRDLVANV